MRPLQPGDFLSFRSGPLALWSWEGMSDFDSVPVARAFKGERCLIVSAVPHQKRHRLLVMTPRGGLGWTTQDDINIELL